MIDLKQYERDFWTAYHGKPTPPETHEERDEVASLLRELRDRTDSATDKGGGR